MDNTVAKRTLGWLELIGAKVIENGETEKFISTAVELNGSPLEIIEPLENADRVAFMVTAVIFGGMSLKAIEANPEFVEMFMGVQGLVLQAGYGLFVQEQRLVNPKTKVEEDAVIFQFKSAIGFDVTMDAVFERAQKMVNYRHLVHDTLTSAKTEKIQTVKADHAYG